MNGITFIAEHMALNYNVWRFYMRLLGGSDYRKKIMSCYIDPRPRTKKHKGFNSLCLKRISVGEGTISVQSTCEPQEQQTAR